MGKETFILYTSFYKPISSLSDKQMGRLFRAIFRYNIGEVVSVEDDIRMAFEFFKNQFEIDESKYQAKIMRDAENGRRGGNPNFKKGKANPYYKKGVVEITQDNPPLSEITQDNPINDNVNDNVNDKGGIDIPPCGGDPHEPPPPDYQAIVDFFNRETQGVFGNIRYPLSEQRRRMVAARIKERGAETFADMVRRAARSDFLRGQNARGWTATFDWLIKPSNFEKVISGNYDNKDPKATPAGTDTRPTDNFLRGVADGIARADYDIQRRGASR